MVNIISWLDKSGRAAGELGQSFVTISSMHRKRIIHDGDKNQKKERNSLYLTVTTFKLTMANIKM